MRQHTPSGFDAVPVLRWGVHLSHFYKTADDLQDLLVPYFKAGLENNESCLWVTAAPLGANQARSALRTAVPDFDRREKNRQIEIRDAREWYASGETLRPKELVSGLLRREQESLDLGYQGLRTNGNCAWVEPGQWPDFLEYESFVHEAVRGRRMICLCSYCTDTLKNGSHVEVMERHDMTVPGAFRIPPGSANGNGSGAYVVDMTDEDAREALERQKRNFDLAMKASQMGTWRYTLADNICVYDENAQRL